MSSKKSETHLFHLCLLIFGGLSDGTGIIRLFYSFGWPGGSFQSDFRAIGFSGLDNIAMLPPGNYSFGLIALGLICMVLANATAWEETDGY